MNRARARILVGLCLGAIGVGIVLSTRNPTTGRPLPPPPDFLPAPIAPSPETAECRAAYAPVLEKPEVRIVVAFGYKDARPARFVADRYERAMLVEYLVSECSAGFHACGFKRDEDDADVFTKAIPGPDGKTRSVRLEVVHSAIGADDDANREDDFQAWQSARAKEAFLTGVREADVVFYNGHSRDGGGPDFLPPTLTEDGHVDYYRYLVRHTGLDELTQALKARPAPLPLLGLFSCASSTHFVETIRNEKPGTGILASARLLYYADALRDLLGGLSAFLAQTCPKGFDASMDKTERWGFFPEE